MEDLLPTEYKIEWGVKRLQNHRSGGASGMWAYHLKGWLAEARKGEALAEKAAAIEGKAAVLVGTGGGEVRPTPI